MDSWSYLVKMTPLGPIPPSCFLAYLSSHSAMEETIRDRPTTRKPKHRSDDHHQKAAFHRAPHLSKKAQDKCMPSPFFHYVLFLSHRLADPNQIQESYYTTSPATTTPRNSTTGSTTFYNFFQIQTHSMTTTGLSNQAIQIFMKQASAIVGARPGENRTHPTHSPNLPQGVCVGRSEKCAKSSFTYGVVPLVDMWNRNSRHPLLLLCRNWTANYPKKKSKYAYLLSSQRNT